MDGLREERMDCVRNGRVVRGENLGLDEARRD